MRQIKHFDISEDTKEYLKNLQNKIINGDAEDKNTNFAAQVNRADKTWKPDNRYFAEIKDALQKMTLAGRCNYCEIDRACDIEHIYPKSKFPALAYTWTNYILACSFCNSYLKIDKFAVFSPKGSAVKIDLKRNSKSVQDTDAPVTDDGLLINPRLENPSDFFNLHITGKTPTFFLTPTTFDYASRNYQRADYTLNELLKLNDTLLTNARKKAYSDLTTDLANYIKSKQAQNFKDLDRAIVSDQPWVDENASFADEQERICLVFKQKILDNSHRTVWDEIKRQRTYLRKTDELFNAAPEALTW